jgi:hypothetical protein
MYADGPEMSEEMFLVVMLFYAFCSSILASW